MNVNVLRFFLGSGWSTLGRLALYGMLLVFPAYSARELFGYAQKGGGPEGLGVFLFLLVESTLAGVCSLLAALWYVLWKPWKVGKKAGVVLAGTVGLPFLLFLAGLPLGDGKLWGFYLYHAGLGGVILLSLWWLDGVRTVGPGFSGE